MSQQNIFESATLSNLSETFSAEPALHISLNAMHQVPTPDTKTALAKFRKPRTKKPSNFTSAKTNSSGHSATSAIKKAGIAGITTSSNNESEDSISKTNKSNLEAYINDYVQRSFSSELTSLATNQNNTTSRELSKEPGFLRRSSSLPALGLHASSISSPSRRSNSKGEESRRRSSWSSSWEHEYDRASTTSLSNNESHPRDLHKSHLHSGIMQTSVQPNHHDSQQPTNEPHPGHPIAEPREPTADQKSSKKTKNSVFETLLTLARRGLRKHLPAKVQLAETVQTVHEAANETTISIYSLDIGPEISQDRSEIAYLRRMQEMEILDHLKQRLFGPLARTYNVVPTSNEQPRIERE